jgi:hypothetical protein
MSFDSFGSVEQHEMILRFTVQENNDLKSVTEKFKATIDGINGTLTRVSKQGGKSIVTTFQKTEQAVDKLTKSYRRNTAGMLGMMFFAMKLKQSISDLFQPAMEAFGIFELWNAMLLVTFIPTMEYLAPILYGIMGWIMGWPDWAKSAAGATLLLVAGLAALTVFIISAQLASYGLAAAGVSVGVAFTTAFLWMAPIAAVIGLLLYITSITGSLKNTFILLGKGIINVFSIIGYGILTLTLAPVKVVIDLITDFLKQINKWMGSSPLVPQWLKDMVAGGINMGTNISAGIQTAINSPLTAAQLLDDKLTAMMDKLPEPAVTAGQNIANGLANGLSQMPEIAATYVNQTNYQLSKLGVSSGVGSSGTMGTSGTSGGGGAVGWTPTFWGDPGSAAASGGWVPGNIPGTNVHVDEHGGLTQMSDFIWRPGEGATAISPDDTVVGTKGGAGGATINQTLNINVSDSREIERLIDVNNRRLVDELRRMVKV